MNQSTHNRLISFIWSIADDCLRDVYVRGKYRDVILPMVVLRRLDALLEPTKDAVMEEVRFQREEAGFTDLEAADLQRESGHVFYNTSPWTLQRIYNTATNSRQQLVANFTEYLDGFSDNVKEIISKFQLRRQIDKMANNNVLLEVLEKFTDPRINLTPDDATDPEGRKLPALTNLGMGYVFEELIRKFNEENNEEAGEHFTPREVIDLMTHLVFDPVKDADQLQRAITIYDPACGSGGMLTESQDFVIDPKGSICATGDVYLYGKEVNEETYAICKSDMMIKGNDPGNIRWGSTLSTDEFAGQTFDFMLSNPPYGKSWSSEQKYIKDGKDVIDARFQVELQDYWGNEEMVDATPRSSDGQLLFLMEMVSKMKDPNQNGIGSRIASVHNGSSLFTGDAGGGESNIRRYLLENDLLEAIIQLPNNLFYNTGITTYIWLLNNHKAPARRRKVLLIDASEQYAKLRKNLGAKNCELKPGHIKDILQAFTEFTDVNMGANAGAENELRAKLFDNDDFGYYKVTVERPERLKTRFTPEGIAKLRFDKQLREPMAYAWETYGERIYTELTTIGPELLKWCEKNDLDLSTKNRKKLTDPKNWAANRDLLHVAQMLLTEFGEDTYLDFNAVSNRVNALLKERKIKLSATQKKAILGAVTEYDAAAEKVIKKDVKLNADKLATLLTHLDCTEADLPLYGYYPTDKAGVYCTYETSSDLRDTESVPLKENVQDYFLREVAPHVSEAWIDLDKTKVGFEISFNKYFYRHKPLRTLEEVTADIIALEKENDGLIAEILKLV